MVTAEREMALLVLNNIHHMVRPLPSLALETDGAGVFFADMTKSQSSSSSTPDLTLIGTEDRFVYPQGSAYSTLVIVHAIFLGLAFVVVFPVGAIGLRLGLRWSFTIHWVMQVIATVASFVGLAVAIALSIIGIEFDGFDEAHQVLGLIVVALLVFQVGGGMWHHVNFKRLGRRTLVSYGHMLLGRVVIWGGMVNAVL
jgi:hypothetical protein